MAGTLVYWFSGTGNSLFVARRIASTLDADAAIVRVTAATTDAPEAPAQQLGLVYPVYCFGPPALVMRLVKNLPPGEGRPAFLVATYAFAAGGALDIVRRALEERGWLVAATGGVRMPENYPPMGGPPAEPARGKILAAAAEKTRVLAEALARGGPASRENANPLFRALGRAGHRAFQRNLPASDRGFRTDDRCDRCGVCALVCPAANITAGRGEPPRWLGHCQQCFACLHWCPRAAIQYGGRSAGQARYHHPETRLASFLAPGRDHDDRPTG